jgi:hypothetical protein
MRFSNSLWKISPALLAMAALILIAGGAVAGPGDNFFNRDAGIDAEENYQGSSGHVDGQGEEYSTSVLAWCVNEIVDYAIGCESTHPDKANLSTNHAQIDQKKRNNNAVAWMSTNKLGGEEVNIDAPLVCEKVQLKGKFNSRNERIEAKCTIKKCKLPEGVTVGDIDDAKDCAADAKESGDLGKRVGNISRNNDDEISGHIKSKGIPLNP